MQLAVIIPAAGKGTRFGGKVPKIEIPIAGKPVFMHAVELFVHHRQVIQVILAVDPDRLDAFKLLYADKLSFMGVKVVPGGKKERWETICNALRAVDNSATHVAVHDAARPLADPALIQRVFDAAARYPAVIPATPVSATVRRCQLLDPPAQARTSTDPLDALLNDSPQPATATPIYRATQTIDRRNLFLVQTPQVIELQLIRKVYQQIENGQVDTAGITDDAGLVEAFGQPIHVVPGDEMNLKITHPQDLTFAEAVMQSRNLVNPGDPDQGKRKFPTWAEMPDD